MGILQTRILEWVAMPSSRAYLRPGHPNPGIEPRTSTLQVDSLLSETPGKPMNTEVGSLSLLQGIFPTQESNQGFLHVCAYVFVCVYIYICLSLSLSLSLYIYIYIYICLSLYIYIFHIYMYIYGIKYKSILVTVSQYFWIVLLLSG